MSKEMLLREFIRDLLTEGPIPEELLGRVNGVKSIVFGPKARQLLAQNGFTPEEIDIVVERLNNLSVDQYTRYDSIFRNPDYHHGMKPALLKAMAIEETTLGKDLTNQQGGEAAGVIQITPDTLKTFNDNLPKGVHYNFSDLTRNPNMSIKIAAHYISDFLMGKKGLRDRLSILRAYKTGADANDYFKRVSAFMKFVNLIGL